MTYDAEMLRSATLLFILLCACGGASKPASAPAAEAAAPAPAPAEAEEGPDPEYQEALRCLEACETTEEGDYDTVEASCREQCGLAPVDD